MFLIRSFPSMNLHKRGMFGSREEKNQPRVVANSRCNPANYFVDSSSSTSVPRAMIVSSFRFCICILFIVVNLDSKDLE